LPDSLFIKINAGVRSAFDRSNEAHEDGAVYEPGRTFGNLQLNTLHTIAVEYIDDTASGGIGHEVNRYSSVQVEHNALDEPAELCNERSTTKISLVDVG
jgi:hypothetical protein